jgi:hypothetical protein
MYFLLRVMIITAIIIEMTKVGKTRIEIISIVITTIEMIMIVITIVGIIKITIITIIVIRIITIIIVFHRFRRACYFRCGDKRACSGSAARGTRRIRECLLHIQLGSNSTTLRRVLYIYLQIV